MFNSLRETTLSGSCKLSAIFLLGEYKVTSINASQMRKTIVFVVKCCGYFAKKLLISMLCSFQFFMHFFLEAMYFLIEK